MKIMISEPSPRSKDPDLRTFSMISEPPPRSKDPHLRTFSKDPE
jgi:hypothetical protein